MNNTMFDAFVDEMTSITKEANWVTNSGMPFVRSVGKNIGGAAKAMLTPIQSTKAGWRQTVSSLSDRSPAGIANTALFALGTAAAVPMIAAEKDPLGSDDSRLARGIHFAGGQVGSLIGMPYGVSGSLAAGIAGDQAGKYLGKAVDRVTGHARKMKQRKALSPAPQTAAAGPTNNVKV